MPQATQTHQHLLAFHSLTTYNNTRMKELFKNELIRAGLGLTLGLLLIIYFNPPHTPCQSQRDDYNDALKPLIKLYNKSTLKCRDHSEPGGCLGLFETLNKMQGKLTELGSQCLSELLKDEKTRSWLQGSAKLFVKLAWGSTAPQSYLYRQGWLELSQVTQYCRLRRSIIAIWSEDEWNGLLDETLSELPGNGELGRNETYNRSLLSDQCKYSF